MEKFDYNLPGGVGCNSAEILAELGLSKEEIEKMREKSSCGIRRVQLCIQSV